MLEPQVQEVDKVEPAYIGVDILLRTSAKTASISIEEENESDR